MAVGIWAHKAMSDWDNGFDAYLNNLDPVKPVQRAPDALSDWPAHRDWRKGEQAAAAYICALHHKPRKAIDIK